MTFDTWLDSLSITTMYFALSAVFFASAMVIGVWVRLMLWMAGKGKLLW